MRKPLLLLFAGILGIGAVSAQEPVILQDKSFDLIPSNEKNPAAAFAFLSRADNEDYYVFTIYNEDFNLVKEFNVPYIKYSETSYTWRPEVVRIKKADVEKRVWDMMSEFSGMTPAQVCEWIKNHYGEEQKTAIFTLDDGTVLVGYNYEKYYSPIEPNDFFVQEGDEWYRAYVQFDLSDCVTEYLPENRDENEYEYDLSPTTTCVYPATGGDEGYYYITRGIYSEDFNYVIPELEQVTFAEQTRENGEKYGYTRSMIKGFGIYDPNGRKLSSLTLPAGYYQTRDKNEINTVSTAGKNYLLVRAGSISDFQADMYGESSYVVYKLGADSRAEQIALAPANSIAPRAPKKGENVSVAVDERFINDNCVVNVISTDGRSMLRKEIAPGQREINFNTSSFPQGIYVVTISGKEGKIESAKIIVR